MAGVDLPVFARRRTVYVIACRTPMASFPLLIDPSGFWVRPEGSGFIAGLAPGEDPDDAPLEPQYEAFESILWPALAARVPAFEAARLERAWAGYYEMNVFDHNGILGLHPEVANLGFINGFSGHGMQQGPIVGRGMAELILHGRFATVDLAPLGYERLVDGRPLRELNVIG
jgi:glycine/D-amino acid oxidase-like deaminating enzyme